MLCRYGEDYEVAASTFATSHGMCVSGTIEGNQIYACISIRAIPPYYLTNSADRRTKRKSHAANSTSNLKFLVPSSANVKLSFVHIVHFHSYFPRCPSLFSYLILPSPKAASIMSPELSPRSRCVLYLVFLHCQSDVQKPYCPFVLSGS